MDKFILAHLIKELILENGKAVLPGFGIFSTEAEEASFSEDGRIINPPTRKIVFQENTAICDDILLERYAAKMNESADSLRPRLETIVREIMEETVNQGSMDFSGFGTLTYHPNGTFSFHSEDGKDFFMERDGLEPIQLRPIERDTPEDVDIYPEPIPAIGEPTDEPELEAEPISDPLPQPIIVPDIDPVPETSDVPVSVENPVPKTKHSTPDKEPISSEDRRFRLQAAIIIVLAVVILGAILLILGRNGAFDKFLYTDEELELIESQDRDIK